MIWPVGLSVIYYRLSISTPAIDAFNIFKTPHLSQFQGLLHLPSALLFLWLVPYFLQVLICTPLKKCPFTFSTWKVVALCTPEERPETWLFYGSSVRSGWLPPVILRFLMEFHSNASIDLELKRVCVNEEAHIRAQGALGNRWTGNWGCLSRRKLGQRLRKTGALITTALWKFVGLAIVCRVEDFSPKTSKKVTNCYKGCSWMQQAPICK